MKSYLLIFGLLAGAVVLVIGIAYFKGGGAPSREEETKAEVGATIYPLFDMARNVAGDNMKVKLILPPGASPHLFEFSPRQLAELKNIKAVFAIGHGLDDWAAQVRNVSRGANVMIMDRGIDLRKFEGTGKKGEDMEHEHGGIDPHYWLHLGNARKITENIAEALGQIDPAQKDSFKSNAQVYNEKLAAEEQRLRQLLAPARGRPILTFHDAWFYFAEDFGLDIVGTFEPAAGQEPTPRYLAELQREMKEKRIRVIFIEPQLSTAVLKSFAEDNHASIAELDPLGGVAGRMTYLDLMEYNAHSVRQALDQQRP